MQDDVRRRARSRLPDLPARPAQRASRTRLLPLAVLACVLGAAIALHLLPRTASTPVQPQARATASDASPSPASSGTAGSVHAVSPYRLLPVTAAQISAAASATASFTAAYGTYSYAQRPAGYLATLRQYAAPALLAQLTQAATTPGLQRQRAQQHASATATATVNAIRDIAGTTITFLVTAREATRSQGRAGSTTVEYALTAAPSGAGWLVYDIEPAGTGQAGSSS
jgi:hypothetical protein